MNERIGNKINDIKINVTGFENAILRVRNNETAYHLQQVMMKIQNKTLTKFQEMHNITVKVDADGNTIVQGKKEARLLGFIKSEKWNYCKILENGNAERVKKIQEYLYKELDKQPCGVN